MEVFWRRVFYRKKRLDTWVKGVEREFTGVYLVV